jgi:hypothetical protein
MSEFGLQPARGRSVIHRQSKIVLKKITLKMDASSGTGQLIDSGEIIRGDILDKPFASGTMKHAYDVCPVHVKFRAHPNFDVP